MKTRTHFTHRIELLNAVGESAKVLGLTILEAFLLRADEVIQ